MIAIPVKTNKLNSAISTLFEKAKYFALINNKGIEIIKNEQKNGQAVVDWLKSKNVDTLITSYLGKKEFLKLVNNIRVYFAGDKTIEIDNVLLKYSEGDLHILNQRNYSKFFKEDLENNECLKINENTEYLENKSKSHNRMVELSDFFKI